MGQNKKGNLGKFSRAFQGLKKELSPDLVKSNPTVLYTERHDTLGFWLWRDNLSTQLEKLPSSNNSAWLNKIKPWLEIVNGHHCMPPKKSEAKNEKNGDRFKSVPILRQSGCRRASGRSFCDRI